MSQFDFFTEPPPAADPAAPVEPSESLDHVARALYEEVPTSKPTWGQLGEITQQVWREKAARYRAGDPEWYATLPGAALAGSEQAS